MPRRLILRLFFALLCQSLVQVSSAATETEVVHQYLNDLRGIEPLPAQEKEKLAALNKRMDSAWTFIRAHQSAALPVVQAELRKATEAPIPDQFFLFDLSYLLLSIQGEKAATLSVSALERIDPKNPVVQANWEELFHCTMKLGACGRETSRYLAVVDRLFLTSRRDLNFFRAPHLVKLNPGDARCFVYGVVGEPGTQHLTELLAAQPGQRPQILQSLSGLGSAEKVTKVQAALTSARDYETVSAYITFLMTVGGPAGRSAVLALDPREFEPRAREYFLKVRPKAEEVAFPTLVRGTEKTSEAQTKLSDAKLQRRLDAMEAHDGADSITVPSEVLKSGIPTARLLAQMKRIRTRSFRRETNHVLEELHVTNAIINALQYKAGGP